MGLPATLHPHQRIAPHLSLGVGRGREKSTRKAFAFLAQCARLGAVSRKIKKLHTTAHTFFPNYCFLRDPKVSF